MLMLIHITLDRIGAGYLHTNFITALTCLASRGGGEEEEGEEGKASHSLARILRPAPVAFVIVHPPPPPPSSMVYIYIENVIGFSYVPARLTHVLLEFQFDTNKSFRTKSVTSNITIKEIAQRQN